jgi:hypothetical protein
MRARLFKSCSRKSFLTHEGAESSGLRAYWCENCRFWHRIGTTRPRKISILQLEFPFSQDAKPSIQTQKP